MSSTEILTLILSTSISVIVTTVISVLIKKFLKDEFAKQERANSAIKLQERQERKEDVLETIKNELNPINERLIGIEEKLEKNSDGTITLLRNEMKSDLDHYRNQGYLSSSDRANWNELYNSYCKLGGNHFKEYVNAWREEVLSFPLKNEH